jgi:Domain of unknown function (DUF4145)
MDIGATKKAYCRKCLGDRNCEVKGIFEQSGSDYDFTWHKDWLILQCCGCDNAFCQTVSTDSESYSYGRDEEGNDIQFYDERIRYWPAKSKRARPGWFAEADSALHKNVDIWPTIEELYGALDNDLTMLATIGVRTVFDVCSSALGVDEKIMFKDKLQKLVFLGKIGVVDKENLELLVEAGNASAHRGWLPKPQELDTIIDVLEHFLEVSFIGPEKRQKLDVKAKKLKDKVPKREK